MEVEDVVWLVSTCIISLSFMLFLFSSIFLLRFICDGEEAFDGYKIYKE